MNSLVRAWRLHAGCLLLALLASIHRRPDIPIDRTCYGSVVAWEMWSGRDRRVMHENDQANDHKPPLFWLIDGLSSQRLPGQGL